MEAKEYYKSIIARLCVVARVHNKNREGECLTVLIPAISLRILGGFLTL